MYATSSTHYVIGRQMLSLQLSLRKDKRASKTTNSCDDASNRA